MGCQSIKNIPAVPQAARLAASNEMTSLTSHMDTSESPTTLRRGYLLGIVRPAWIKVTESEQRLLGFKKWKERN